MKTIQTLCLLAGLSLVSTLEAVDRATTYTYTPEGLISSVDGPRTDTSDITTFSYDTAGNRITMTNALGHLTQYTDHDGAGRLLRMVDPNGLVTRFTYHPRGWLLSTTLGEGSGETTTLYDYDAAGNLIRISPPTGEVLEFLYDAANRLIEIEDALGNRVRYTLDTMGNRIVEETEDPQGTVTRTLSRLYNELNRLVQQTGADPARVSDYAYDDNGNQTTVTDALNHTRTSHYDALNRVQQVIDPKNGQTDYAYDAQDNLTGVTDPLGLTTAYTYDGLGNRIQVDSPDTGTSTYTYDAAGNLLQHTDARGVIVTYTYDALNRLLTVSYPDSTLNVTYTYDAGINGLGRLSGVQDFSGTTGYAYDPRGNLLSETWTRGSLVLETQYAYDASNRLIGITYPSGRMIDYGRDSLGQIDQVSLTDGAQTQVLADTIHYLPFGPLQSLTFGNGLPLSRSYDQDYQLTQQTSATVQDLSFLFDPAGNLTGLTDALSASQSQTFGYDELNRLTQADGGYGSRGYTYDGAGNRLSETRGGTVDSYTYAAASHQLDAVQTGSGTPVTRNYDGAGNTAQLGGRVFTYDDMNRLMAVDDSGLEAVYEYNSEGQRTAKTVNGVTTLYVYDTQGQLIAEVDDTGATGKEYVYLDGQLLSMLIPGQPWNVDRFEFTGDDYGSSPTTLGTFEVDFAAGQIRYSAASGRTITLDQAEMTSWDDSQYENGRNFAADRHASNEHFSFIGYFGVSEFNGEIQTYSSVYMNWVPERYHSYYFAGDKDVTLNGSDGTTGDTASFELDASGLMTLVEEHEGTTVFTPTILSETDYGTYVYKEYLYASGGLTVRGWLTDYGTSYSISIEAYAGEDPQYVAFHSDTNGWTNQGQVTPHAALYYYHTDHLGTPQKLTDANQNLVWRAEQLPFGQMNLTLEQVTNNIRFPGQYFDPETGLHYNYFRTYDPSTGRYLESDPIGLEGGLNTYAYSLSNPNRFTDPKGLAVPAVVWGVAEGIKWCLLNPTCAAGVGAIVVWGMGNQSDDIIPFPGSNDNAGDQTNDGETCEPDDGDDCKEWRALLQQQRDAILANFLRGETSIREFNSLVLEHNQAVEFYKIECEDNTADSLKL